MLKDLIHVTDRGVIQSLDSGRVLDSRPFGPEKSLVEVKGWVKTFLRERGKIVPGSLREGHNVWTNVGREYLAQLMQLDFGAGTNRNDRMKYIGVGSGFQLEDPGVVAFISPLPYLSGTFLAQLDQPTFPLTPIKTTVRYHRLFLDSEIPAGGGTIYISELGLFTDGGPESGYTPGSRLIGIATASNQPPMAYKSIDPFGKTDSLELEVFWENRF